jgi:crotonobetainyl-CoA:carnitine CoA-transferase CaiB-like acyl-CoA transferase
MSAAPVAVRRAPPRLGEHSAELLAEAAAAAAAAQGGR